MQACSGNQSGLFGLILTIDGGPLGAGNGVLLACSYWLLVLSVPITLIASIASIASIAGHDQRAEWLSAS